MKRKEAKIEAKILLKENSAVSLDESSSDENPLDDDEGDELPKAGG